jgi:8-oxo-dGTP pyrophosphatase MutT (NUDIX family)
MNNEAVVDRTKLTYRQSTCALVTDKLGRVLIVQKKNYRDNEWDIPGGGVEAGETPTQAILREALEELGSDKFEIVKVSQHLDCYDWPPEAIVRRLKEKGKTYLGQQRTQFLIKFTGEEQDITPQVGEIKAIKWVLPSELEKYLISPNQFNKMTALLAEFGI